MLHGRAKKMLREFENLVTFYAVVNTLNNYFLSYNSNPQSTYFSYVQLSHSIQLQTSIYLFPIQ